MSVLAEKQRRFTVDEYRAMGCAGILKRGDRVELIDGLIIAMSPFGDPHVGCVNQLNYLFAARLYTGEESPRAIVSVHNPVRLNQYSEPQRDVVLIRPNRAGVPEPEDVLLVI